MAACGSLRHLFERQLPENPTLMESLSWSQINAVKQQVQQPATFTEIFGELHFVERRSLGSPAQFGSAPSSPGSDRGPTSGGTGGEVRCREGEGLPVGSNPRSDGDRRSASLHGLFDLPSNQCRSGSPRSRGRSASLQLCTEGLGFESSDKVEDPRAGSGWDWGRRGRVTAGGAKRRLSRSLSEALPRRRGEFPPPISSIGSSGKPCVCFRSYREDGRFVLREVKIPTQELLRASREDGRLKLHFAQPDEGVATKCGGGEEGEGAEEEEGEHAEGGGEEVVEEIGAN